MVRSRRFFVSLLGLAMALCLVFIANAGPVGVPCDGKLEVNANRAGSPSVSGSKDKKVTVKARIIKASGSPDAQCSDGEIEVTPSVNGTPQSGLAQSVTGQTFVVGRGGQGDNLLFDLSGFCPGDDGAAIDFIAVASAPGGVASSDPNSGKTKTLDCS